jgi:hypothetical protein
MSRDLARGKLVAPYEPQDLSPARLGDDLQGIHCILP